MDRTIAPAVAPEPPTPALLEHVLEALTTAVGVLRAPDFRYEVANAACAVIAPGRTFLGRTFAEIAPELAGAVLPLLRRVVETREPFVATDLRLGRSGQPFGEHGHLQLVGRRVHFEYHAPRSTGSDRELRRNRHRPPVGLHHRQPHATGFARDVSWPATI